MRTLLVIDGVLISDAVAQSGCTRRQQISRVLDGREGEV